jgi:putative phosphotransacetylase
MTTLPIEVSARHVHLTEADWSALFGAEAIASDRQISQPQQFVAKQRVSLRGPKGEYANVAIVGPFRAQTQVELAPSEARHLGINPPVAESGHLDSAVTLTIIGPKGSIDRDAAMTPERHIHAHPDDAAKHGLHNGQLVSIEIAGQRGARLDQVVVRVDPDYAWRLHLDIDEGNACGVQPGMSAELVQ